MLKPSLMRSDPLRPIRAPGKADPAARAVALRETSRACTDGSTDEERLALSAHQSEANDAFCTLRSTYVRLRDDLLLLRQNSAALGAAAHVLERNFRLEGTGPP